jgi:hypothetical protein
MMDFGFGTRGGFVLVVLVGVLVPGLTNHVLSQSGYHTLGSVVWAVGYAAMAIVLYLGWVRPLELTGPDDAVRKPEEDDAAGSGPDTDGTGGEPESAEPN